MQELFFCFIHENGILFGIILIAIVIVIIVILSLLVRRYGVKLIRWIISKKPSAETDEIKFSRFGVDISVKGKLAYVVVGVLFIIIIGWFVFRFLPDKIPSYSVAMDASSKPKTLLEIKEKFQEDTESKIEISPSLQGFEVTGSFSGKCVAHLFKLICDRYSSEIECDWSLRKRTLSLSPAEKGSFAGNLIFFDKDSANLTHSEEKKLDALVQKVKINPNITLVLYGYSDDTGSHDYNIDLISRRINVVKNYLVSGGVETTRISVGKRLVVKSDKDSRKKNRRVEVIVK